MCTDREFLRCAICMYNIQGGRFFFLTFFVLFLVCFPRVVGTWRARGERKRERKLKIIRKNCTTAIVLMEIKKKMNTGY